MPTTSLDDRSRRALVRLLEAPKLEVLPVPSTLKHVETLVPGTTLAVSASPSRGLEATVDVAVELERRGFRAVPHIAARMVRDRDHLAELTGQLAAAGIDRALVVGGDAREPGAFPDGLSLLREMAETDSPIREIGIPGYPQGHPFVEQRELDSALAAKAPYAAYVTTQLCFDPGAIRAWVKKVRSDGVHAPFHLGIGGAISVPRLVEISARIGVTDAARFALRHSDLVGPLLTLRGYHPDSLLSELAPILADEDACVTKLHVYTFNQVEATDEWRRRYLADLRDVMDGLS